MSFQLECKKIKRTGFLPAFIGGGILSAMIPVLNMAVRAKNYTGINDSPVSVLLDANWQMMAMLNTLILITVSCIIYHIEYADNAIQKICTFPIKEHHLYFGKMIVTLLLTVLILAIQGGAVGFCAFHWFGLSSGLTTDLLKMFGCSILFAVPAALLSLFFASVCKNMWISLGIGVVCIFAASMFPPDNFALSLFPFALPFQIPFGMETRTMVMYLIAVIAEICIICLAELLFIKIRRSFE